MDQQSSFQRWMALIFITMGIFMAMLDVTIVNIVLPKMMASLDADVYSVEWVLLANTLGMIITMASMGWIGTHISTKTLFIAGLILFTTMSMLCGMAPNLTFMEVSRFLQGVGVGALVTSGLTIIYTTYPKGKQGMALGFYAFGASVAPAVGPTLGGILTDTFTWRAIFYVNVPIGIVAVLGAVYFLRRPPKESMAARRPFDLVGFVLMVVCLSSLNIFLSKGQEYNWLQSDYILYLFLAFIVTLVPFVIVSCTKENPLLDLKLLVKNSTLGIAVFVQSIYAMIRFGMWIVIPLYLEQVRHYETLTTGYILLPGSIAGAIGTLLGGMLSDRWNPRTLVLISLVGMTISSFYFHTDVATWKWHIAWDFTVWSFFACMAYSPILKLAMSDLGPKDANMGATLVNVSRLVFASVGISIAVAIETRKADAIYVALSSKVNYGSVMVRKFIAEQLEIYGTSYLGEPFRALRANLQLFIQQYAHAYAYGDTFKILGFVSILSVVAALFIRYKASPPGSLTTGLEEDKITQ